jgi:hypothetical protein
MNIQQGSPGNGGVLSREQAQGMADHDLLVETSVTVSYLAKSLDGCQQSHSGTDLNLWKAVNDLRQEINQAKGGISVLKWVCGVGMAVPGSLLAVVVIMQMAR